MKQLLGILMLTLLTLNACKKEEGPDSNRQPDETYNPEILPKNFTNSTELTNTYMLLEPGKKYIYEGQTEDGLERIED